MSHYSRDLTAPCACAGRRDAEWFIANPSRRKYIREPWECEYTTLDGAPPGMVSQIVAVWMDRSVNDAVGLQAKGLVEAKIYRRSFLFAGEADWHRIDSDEGVDRFMYFIDDTGHSTIFGARPN